MRGLTTVLVTWLVAGCAISGPSAGVDTGNDHFHGAVDLEEPFYDELADSAGTVRHQLSRCSTAGVLGLAEQIVGEMRCMDSSILGRLESSETIQFTGPAVMPYFTVDAIEGLEYISQFASIEVRSGYRTVVQQYLIHSWKAASRCRIRAAAEPGESSHESGRAIDIQNHEQVLDLLIDEGWVQSVAGDPIHFLHADSPDLSGLDVEAFQRLWNRNHPSDQIVEDGDFGGATAWRLESSPAAGFARGPECGPK